MSSQYNRAMYVGTFDPLTNGHCDIITRACGIFSELVIGIGDNRQKNCFFTPEQRKGMIDSFIANKPGVSVKIFSGLSVDFAKHLNINILIRGLRTGADYTYEMQMAAMNQSLRSELETIFMPTNQAYSHISSALVKEVASLGGDVSSMVPGDVVALLKSKLS